jgi:hypothetical protein
MRVAQPVGKGNLVKILKNGYLMWSNRKRYWYISVDVKWYYTLD